MKVRAVMERMLVVVFDTEKKAYEGVHALNALHREGSIAIYAESVIQKNANGTVDVKKAEDDLPIRTLAGTALGSLIGLLEGPVGVVVGSGVGATAGLIGDAYVAGVNLDFVDDVAAKLTAGKFAVIADIEEEWVTPVDTAMESLGGVVYRSAKSDVEAEQWARDIAEMEADLEQLNAEYEQARAERKAKIQGKIDNLSAKLRKKSEQANQRAEAIKNEGTAKVQALQQRAQKAHSQTRAAMEARIVEIRERHEQSEAKLRRAAAERLKKAAKRLERAG
jgi:uncharacterized membrane protein